MVSFFSRLKGRDGSSNKKKGQLQTIEQAAKPQWVDAWTRTSVEPEEVQELLHGCTIELKSKALDVPFLLLPFRPTSDPSAARTFIRNYFDRAQQMHGDLLLQELRLTEPMVLCSVVKWCWSRLAGGVVSWDAYELFRTGEHDSNMARDSFSTFIPLSVDSDARTKIITDFFELLAAIAAHGKTNGLSGRKLSRLAGWWAFEHSDTGKGFDGGYKGWTAAADATSHLFFAYLRSQTLEELKGLNGMTTLPLSLQKLVQETEYPPQTPSLMLYSTPKVVMIVETVSPTPFALLRRANHFEYRDDDYALQQFSSYEDPVKALTDECRRVLRSISSANQSQASTSKDSTGLKDASWSRFEDLGFGGAFDEAEEDDNDDSLLKRKSPHGLRSTPRSGAMNMGRPTTPSWADFLSSGFVDEKGNGPAPLLLPPDKVLPPIETSRGRSSQSHRPRLETNQNLDPGELANISKFDLDEAFWWVWISSLAGEEPAGRKAAFGRCALVETVVPGGKWLVMEEIVKGAAPEPAAGAYVAEKKSRFGWTRRNKGMTRSKSNTTKDHDRNGGLRPPYATQNAGVSKTSIGPDQHARIQAAAAQLQQRQRQQEMQQDTQARRGRSEQEAAKTNSVLTLQPNIVSELSPAMKWASKYDKEAIREAYLANNNTGKGQSQPLPSPYSNGTSNGYDGHLDARSPGSPLQLNPASPLSRDLPAVPTNASETEIKPVVPAKTVAPEVAPLSPTPASMSLEKHLAAGKAAEVALPSVTHQLERQQINTPTESTLPRRKNEQQSLAQFLTEEAPPENLNPMRPSVDSIEGKGHNKLKKKSGGGGFKKMFGRKNRESKVPENAPVVLNGSQTQSGQLQSGGATLGRRFSGFRKRTPENTPPEKTASQFSQTAPSIDENDLTPVQSPYLHPHDRSYEPSAHESLSRVDTADAHEARQAFSSFDQGPLDDVPAFIPEDSPVVSARQSEEAAAPPEIPRARARARAPVAEPVSPVPPPGKDMTPVQDRWAQIKKNAAERAAMRQSEEQSRGGHSAATDGDGETSGEETIESRVARIKARVAELTGNMENDSNGRPSRPPVHR